MSLPLLLLLFIILFYLIAIAVSTNGNLICTSSLIGGNYGGLCWNRNLTVQIPLPYSISSADGYSSILLASEMFSGEAFVCMDTRYINSTLYIECYTIVGNNVTNRTGQLLAGRTASYVDFSISGHNLAIFAPDPGSMKLNILNMRTSAMTLIHSIADSVSGGPDAATVVLRTSLDLVCPSYCATFILFCDSISRSVCRIVMATIAPAD